MKWRSALLLLSLVIIVILSFILRKKLFSPSDNTGLVTEWHAPDTSLLSSTPEGQLILYGRQLISNTSKFLGPKGTVAAITNGMNCQNCHLDAGSKAFGNCFSAVAANYPQFRSRSGIVESIEFRVNDCLQRSLNGKTIDNSSKEMQAMVAYLKWIGKDVPKKTKPKGSSNDIPYLQRAADSAKGQVVYVSKCERCHGKRGEGILKADLTGYIYPPLWGDSSYNISAGLYRLSRFAGYVKYNMPFDKASNPSLQLSNDEAWDVAAFVNSQPRPVKFFEHDWPDIKMKAVDYPLGPFADTFSVQQHKYGPFEPIEKARQAIAKK
ncbi:MAG: c-type cytochrome [Bacteroidetes bacterium]|nr:c-type cytochrome [Bacteroidota bacterium]